MPDASSQPLLKVNSLGRRYGERDVLCDFNLSVSKGERVAIMGPSGSGKSTLLNCLAGIDQPDSGHIHFEGEDLTAASPERASEIRRLRLSTIFQFFHLLPTLSVTENIEFPLQLTDTPTQERNQRVQRLVESVGLTHRADAFPDQLSGGEMQRVAIARALVHQPRLILADEPTGNLDSRTGESILDLLEQLTSQHETSMILVTHSAAATRICQRTIHMQDGRILKPAEISE